MITTISYEQDDILNGIIELYCTGGFECDLTYSAGNFYDHIPQPKYKFDLEPQAEGVLQADSRNVPLPDHSVQSVVFDPPFVAGWSTGKGASSIIRTWYSSYRTIAELWAFYHDTMIECKRILVDKGFLVFKCQDTVQDHKNYFSHIKIMNDALKIGFYPKDMFVLLAKQRMPRVNQTKQEHARKFHSYFWVFQNMDSRVCYE